MKQFPPTGYGEQARVAPAPRMRATRSRWALLLLAAGWPRCRGAEAPLREWLEGLSLELPPFAVLPAHLGFGVDVTGGTCEGAHVGGLAAAAAHGGVEGLALEVSLTDLGFSCSVGTSFRLLGVRRSCDVHLVVARSSLVLEAAVASRHGLPAGDPPPRAACRAILEVKELSFEGRAAGCRALGAAEAAIRRLVSGSASRACNAAVAAAADHGARLVAALVALAQPFLEPVPPLPAPSVVPGAALDLRAGVWAAPAGAAVRSLLADVGLGRAASLALRDLGLLDSSGRLVLPSAVQALLPATVQVPAPLTRGSVLAEGQLNALSVSGDGAVDPPDAAVSGPQTSRVAGTVAPAVEANLEVFLKFPRGRAVLEVLGHSWNLTESKALRGMPVLISGQLQASAALSLFAAFNKVALNSLGLDQMQRSGCGAQLMVRGLRGGPVQVLDIQARLLLLQLQVWAPGLSSESLEVQLLNASALVAQAAFEAFGGAALQAVSGLVARHGRDLANKQLVGYFSTLHACPASNFSTGLVESVERPSQWLASGLLGLGAACLASMPLAAAGRLLRRATRRPSAGCCEARGAVGEGPGCWDSPTASPSNCAGGREQDPAALGGPAGALLGDAGPGRAALARAVPAALGWGMVLGILGTISLFVVATVTPGVAVQLHFAGAGGTWASPDIARLSLDNSVSQMLRSRALFLAGVVIVFSLIWPYVKLLLMLYAWLVPMRTPTRGALLVFLDQIGKWSLTDNIAMFLLIVLFWIRWSGADVTASSSGASLGLSCAPGEELNMFVAATVLSLALGHTMLGIHRWHCGGLHTEVASDSTCREALCRRLTRKGSRPPMLVAVGTAVSILMTLMLILAGWCVEIVEIRMDGLVGVFQDVIGEPRAKRYSMLNIVERLGTQGSLYLQAVLVTFVMLLPPLYLAALLVLWLAPLAPRGQLRLFVLCQTLSAWSSLDVFVMAYLGAVLGGEKYGIAQFLEMVIYQQNTGPVCSDLRHVGVECLSVRITMLPAMALVISAALAAFGVGSFVYRRAYLAIHVGKPVGCAGQRQ